MRLIPDIESSRGITYFVDEAGCVVTSRGRVLSTYITVHGYVEVYLNNKVKGNRAKRVHRLVAEAYLANPEGLPEVDHRDRDKLNNHKDNLRWTDRKGNALNAGKKVDLTSPGGESLQFDTITQAAAHLGVTSSACSHALKYNRSVVGYKINLNFQ